jgi:hypothetical protein
MARGLAVCVRFTDERVDLARYFVLEVGAGIGSISRPFGGSADEPQLEMRADWWP